MVSKISDLLAELQSFSDYLDQHFNGVMLCMAYLTVSAADSSSWTFCVSADELDEKSERAALSIIIKEMEGHVSRTVQSMIERVVILRVFDPDASEIFSTLKSPDDAYLLIGHTILGREIRRAHVFIIRGNMQQVPQRQSVRA
jgi:hypothetical protein